MMEKVSCSEVYAIKNSIREILERKEKLLWLMEIFDFRQPKEKESEENFRNALADFVSEKYHPFTGEEIRLNKKFRFWSSEQRTAFFLKYEEHPFIKEMAKSKLWQ